MMCVEPGRWCMQQMAPHVLEESPAKARRDFQALKDALMAAEVEPVRGRQPWAVADAVECLRPSLDAPGEEDDGGLLREDGMLRPGRTRRDAWRMCRVGTGALP